MNFDYYELLGAPPDASMQDIKIAYRRRAVACHPDHGGAHEKMLLINEAWEVLSDPYTRMHYDYARSNQYDYAAQRVAAEEQARARKRAQEHPHAWNDFEAWLERSIWDFTDAEYIYPADQQSRSYFSYFPNVKDSFSGKLFCVIGALTGFIVGGVVFEILKISSGQTVLAKGILTIAPPIMFFLCAPMGALLGCALHQKIGKRLSSVLRQHSS
jgi:DnaJ family protein A protein 2